MFSVDTEKEARDLLVLTCPTDMEGEFVARELVHEQTLENLEAFGDKLERAYEIIKKRRAVVK